MADVVVTYLLDNITQLLKDEANLLSGVSEKVVLLQQELEMINSFLKNSEGKRNEHDLVKVVVRQIRKVAQEAQDVIDNYVVDVVAHKKKGMVKRLMNVGHAKMLHSVNDQIENIKVKINEIYNNKGKYEIKEDKSGVVAAAEAAAKMKAVSLAETVKRRRSDVEEDKVVGFDEYIDEVTKLLVKGSTSCQVVAIVGMVGCGKTTLARKVFRDPLVTSQLDGLGFDCLAWYVATKAFDAKKLLLSLLRSFEAIDGDELNVTNENKEEQNDDDDDGSGTAQRTREIAMLKSMLREHLSETRYLIVIDDVWSSQVLEEIKDAFPDDKMGSRILITTRDEKVASEFNSKVEPCTYKLKRLGDDHSWTLFSYKVFRGEDCFPNLVSLGKKIAHACKGLPLSIVVIAGYLRSKEKSERVWEKVIKDVNWYINQEDKTVKEIVRLSYESLPQELKPCFLYFGIYPEDYDISVRQLIHLWVAEGFIQQTGHSSVLPEDIAEEYLEDLILRNLIQVESRRTDGGVKTCRIHDLLRELCISESIEENFLDVLNRPDTPTEGIPRRLSFQGNMSEYMSHGPCDYSTTRSLFCFSKDDYNYHEFQKWLTNNFKLIRVVDAGRGKLSTWVVDVLEELIHLRYFKARGADRHGNSFPKTICNLWNLETLDLRGSGFAALPDGIWKLKRLRHLYMYGPYSTATLPKIIGKKSLPNVQTVTGLCLDSKTAQQLEKGKFPNLRKLGVDCLYSSEPNPIELLQKLQCLIHLNTLRIFYGKGALTSVEGFPPNITKITLVGGHLSGIVSPFGSLLTLRYLKISRYNPTRYDELELECVGSGCFPQLQVLKMTGIDCKKWNMGEGGMPQLKRWVINDCKFSANLPSADSFTALKEVEVLWSSKEVVDKFQHLAVKDTCKLTVFPPLAE